MKKPRSSITVATLLLVLFLYCYGLVRYLSFVRDDRTPPHRDFASHLTNVLFYRELMQTHQWKDLINSYFYYPPAVYFEFIPFAGLFDLKMAIVFYNFVLLGILLVVVVCASYLILKDSLFGLLSALLLLLIVLSPADPYDPWVIKLWEFMLDWPLTVFVLITILSIYSVISLRRRSQRLSSTIGFLVGLSILTKWSAIFFLVVPVFHFLFVLCRRKKKDSVIAFLLAVLVTGGWWYLLHWKELLHSFVEFSQDGVREHDPQGLFPGMLYYISLFKYLIRWFWIFPVVMLIARFFRAIQTSYRKAEWSISTAILVPFLIFSLLTNKDQRYLFPVFLLITLISLLVIWKRASARLQGIIVFFIVIRAFSVFTHLTPAPNTEISLFDKLTSFLEAHEGSTIAYFFEEDTPTFNYPNVRFAEKMKRARNALDEPIFLNYDGSSPSDSCRGHSPDYIVVQAPPPAYLRSTSDVSFEIACSPEVIDRYQVVERWFSSDGESVRIYGIKEALKVYLQ